MPWKERKLMEECKRFIHEIMESTRSFNATCLEFGISRKTGYKWLHRFEEGGYPGLEDQSRRPNTSPGQLVEGIVCELIKLKLAHNTWGPKKIRELYGRVHEDSIPSLSSVNRVFKKAGLVKRRRVRTTRGGRMTNSIRVQAPNDVWTIDFKGWWRVRPRDRFEPLTVRDAHSRYLLEARSLTDTSTESVKQVFVKLFKEYGLPKVVHSDNGTPFAARSNVRGISQLSAWLISLGIHIHHSRPRHPQDNGGHERMHKDLKEEVQIRYTGDAKLYQAELDKWRDEFNTIRPHEALRMKTPAELYHCSEREYPVTQNEIEYPNTYQVRKVSAYGEIKIKGNNYFITTALRKYMLGLKVIDATKLAVYFASVFLGKIDLETISFTPYQDEMGFEK
jgi:putative transposase